MNTATQTLATAAMREDQFLRTAPLAAILADTRARKAAALKPPLDKSQIFAQLAEWAIDNLTDDEQDRFTAFIAALTPHMDRETSAMYWADLKTGVAELAKAEDGEHPGDIDAEGWRDQCRDDVESAAYKLAGA